MHKLISTNERTLFHFFSFLFLPISTYREVYANMIDISCSYKLQDFYIRHLKGLYLTSGALNFTNAQLIIVGTCLQLIRQQ